MTNNVGPGAAHNGASSLERGGDHTQLNTDLIDVAASLHRRFDPDLGAAAVGVQIQLTADQFTNARIRVFVPLFVRRFTVEALTPRLATV